MAGFTPHDTAFTKFASPSAIDAIIRLQAQFALYYARKARRARIADIDGGITDPTAATQPVWVAENGTTVLVNEDGSGDILVHEGI